MSGDSQSDDAGAVIDFDTARSRDYPVIRQFTLFLENRVGALMMLLRRFNGSKARFLALSISDAADCSVVRCILSHPDQGREIFERAGLAMIESDLICLVRPDSDQPILEICNALLKAEVNLLQVYPLMVHPDNEAAVAIMVDNIDQSQTVLATAGFRMLSEDELQSMI